MRNELHIDFNFAPVPYRAREVAQFKNRVHEQLALINEYFVCECSVKIELYLTQDRCFKTDEYADLDNYAKSILDALKGQNGIILDDCLIDHLSITRMEFLHGEKFRVTIGTMFWDTPMRKPITLYGMPDGMYYPLPQRWLMQDGTLEEKEEFTGLFLNAIHEMTKLGKEWQHKFRQSGVIKEQASQEVLPILPILKGLPKSRIVDSGFKIIELQTWKL